MNRWLPSPLLSIGLLLTWLLLNESIAAAHWLLGAALGLLAPLLVRPLLPHGHARLRRPRALLRLLWLSAIEIVRSAFTVGELILLRRHQPRFQEVGGESAGQRPNEETRITENQASENEPEQGTDKPHRNSPTPIGPNPKA